MVKDKQLPSIEDLRPIFSVIVATYNSATHVAEALRSLVSNSTGTLEVIVVDGGSQDGTMNIVTSICPLARIISQRTKGIYGALNEGVAAARSPWVTFLHSDDIWLSMPDPTKLEDSDSDRVWVGDVAFFRRKDEVLYRRRLPVFPDIALRQFPFIFHPNGIYPRGLLVQFPYDEATHGRKADMHQIALLGDKVTFQRMPEFCYGFRIHSESTTVRNVWRERESLLFWIWRIYVFLFFEDNRIARIKSRILGKKSWM